MGEEERGGVDCFEGWGEGPAGGGEVGGKGFWGEVMRRLEVEMVSFTSRVDLGTA